MESDSPEIDFLSLEDELYDNEITQILSQPSAAESTYTDLLQHATRRIFNIPLH